MTQGTFNVTTTVVKKDQTKKWNRLKKKMLQLQGAYKSKMVINEISNEALVDKIVKMMDRFEKND